MDEPQNAAIQSRVQPVCPPSRLNRGSGGVDDLHVVHACAAGLDLHKVEVTATMRLCEGGGQPVCETAAHRPAGTGLSRWQDGYPEPAMETAGVYWEKALRRARRMPFTTTVSKALTEAAPARKRLNVGVLGSVWSRPYVASITDEIGLPVWQLSPTLGIENRPATLETDERNQQEQCA